MDVKHPKSSQTELLECTLTNMTGSCNALRQDENKN